MALGPRDTSSLVMLTGWDAIELKKFQLADGTTYETVAQMLGLAMGGVNAELANAALWSTLVSYTDQPDIEYRVGASISMERHTEYGLPDQQRATTEGHMLPFDAWDFRLGWTWDYLRRARISQVQADIAAGAQAVRNKWRLGLLTRLFQRGDDSIGASGYSPGFATTAASTSVDFVPPAWGGQSFTSTHEHYIAITGGAFTVAVFTDIRDELREHGHLPPYDVLIGPSDESTVRGLTGFIQVGQQLVSYGNTTTLATFGAEDDELSGSYYIGMINDCRVRVVPGIPQYYAFGYKSYGANNPKNPLRIRLDKGQSRPAFMVMTDPRSGKGAYPLQNLMVFGEFGVGVGDRTNGTPRYVNSTTWADGTPT